MEKHLEANKPSKSQVYLAWFSAALFYLYQYILRVAPGVMVTDLRAGFQMTAQEFASLGAVYLYMYALVQIPVGIMIDKVGIKRTMILSASLCTIGTALFGYASNLPLLQISRALLGAGSATAFLGALKITADYLPQGKRGFFMGLTMCIGTLGALAAGKPLVVLIDNFGWREAIKATSLLGAFIVLLLFIFLRLPRPTPNHEKKLYRREILASIRSILKNKHIIIYALIAIGLYAPVSALADLWGTAFIMQKFSVTRAEAAELSLMLYVGLAIGSFILPGYFEKKNMINLGLKLGSLGLLITFAFLLYGPLMTLPNLTLLLILIGFFCGSEIACFTGASTYSTVSNSGLTIAIVNIFNMIGGAFLQQTIGFILDRQWQGDIDSMGTRLYNTNQFLMALSVLLVVIALCALISFSLKSKKSQ